MSDKQALEGYSIFEQRSIEVNIRDWDASALAAAAHAILLVGENPGAVVHLNYAGSSERVPTTWAIAPEGLLRLLRGTYISDRWPDAG